MTNNSRGQSIFFRKEFASDVFHDILHNEEPLLDNPFERPARLLEFFQVLDHIDPSLENYLKNLMHLLDLNGYNGDMVDEHLIFLLQHLIGIQN